MSRKFIPNGDLDFVTMARGFAGSIAKGPGRYGVSDADAAALSEAVARFDQAYKTAKFGGRSALAIAEKEAARAEAERLVRRIANSVRASDTVSSLDKLALGLRERTKRPKVQTVPKESPNLTFVRAYHEGGGATPEHELAFGAQDSKPKPPGAVRLELFVDLIAPDAAIPPHPGATRGSRPFYLRSYTRSPIRLIPPMANVPMRVVYWGRWADSAGNVGPFSETAVGWIEGGSHYRQTRPLFKGNSRPLRVEVMDQQGDADEPDTVIVALLAAAGQSMHGATLSRALPDETSRSMKQLQGPDASADATTQAA